MIRKQFDSFERTIRSLVEGTFRRSPGTVLNRQDVLKELQNFIRENAARRPAPGAIVEIRMHPSDLERLRRGNRLTPDWLKVKMAEHDLGSHNLAKSMESIRLSSTSHLAQGIVEIVLAQEAVVEERTQAMQVPAPNRDSRNSIDDLDAFLIVNGREHFLLREPLISIGRHPDADLVLSSPRVSRQHAQIRHRFGRYVIYDLTSRAGTIVNNERIREVVLSAGDVIRLGDTDLIYGENRRREIRADDFHEESDTQVLHHSDDAKSL